MKKFINLLIIVLTIVFSVSAVFSSDYDEKNRQKGKVIVKLKKDVFKDSNDLFSKKSKSIVHINSFKNEDFKIKLNNYGFKNAKKVFKSTPEDTIGISRSGEIIKLLDLSRWFVFEIDPTFDVDSVINDFKKSPYIEKVEPCQIIKQEYDTPDDPYFPLQHALEYGTTGDINILDAWDYQTGRADVLVAVVDGGVDNTHNDLVGRWVTGRDVYDDDSNPYPETTWEYDRSHGIKVAGIIGAQHNSIGIAGIMHNCRIMPVKMANELGEIVSNCVGPAIEWAYDHDADIINCSWGGYKKNSAEQEAIFNAYQLGVVIVASAGNGNTEDEHFPSNYTGVLSVGASDLQDYRATWTGGGSNYGDYLGLVAPGSDTATYSTGVDQSYGYFGHTSCAAPHASGVAGLILSESRDLELNLTNDDIRHILQLTAEKVHPELYSYDVSGKYGWNKYVGYGRLDAKKSLEILNPPYFKTTGNVTGGIQTLVSDSHTQNFIDIPGLPYSGKYYGVKTYKVSGSVSFYTNYATVPYV